MTEFACFSLSALAKVLCLQHRCIQGLALTAKAGIALNEGPSVYFTGMPPSFAKERGGPTRKLSRRRTGKSSSDCFLHQSQVPTGSINSNSTTASVFSGPFQIAFLSSCIDADQSSFRWIPVAGEPPPKPREDLSLQPGSNSSLSIWKTLSAAVCGNHTDQDPGHVVEAGTTVQFSIVSGLAVVDDDGQLHAKPTAAAGTIAYIGLVAIDSVRMCQPRFEPHYTHTHTHTDTFMRITRCSACRLLLPGDETSLWSVLAFTTPFHFDPECELQRFEPSTGLQLKTPHHNSMEAMQASAMLNFDTYFLLHITSSGSTSDVRRVVIPTRDNSNGCVRHRIQRDLNHVICHVSAWEWTHANCC